MLLHVQKYLEEGGTSRVFVATVTTSVVLATRTVVAVKKARITKHIRNSVLRHEACVYLLLQGHPNISKVYAWGRSQYYEYLVLELLGDDTGSVLDTPEKLTLNNLVAMVCQMIDAIQHIHSHHLIHGDIKPSNFLFAPNFASNSHGGRIFIIDFGLSKYYRDSTTLAYHPEGTTRTLRGTPDYASIPSHLHITSSRRDDMESLAYTMVKFLRGSLPWSNARLNSDRLRIKREWSGRSLCIGYPSVFGDFVDYTRALGFNEKPQYSIWRERFLALVPGMPKDAPYRVKDRCGQIVGLGVPSDLQYAPKYLPSAWQRELSYGAEDTDPLPAGTDGWYPASFEYTWQEASPVKDADQLGDEDRRVFEAIEWVEAPPTEDEPTLAPGLTEIMVPNPYSHERANSL